MSGSTLSGPHSVLNKGLICPMCVFSPSTLVLKNQLGGLKKSLPLDGAIMDFRSTKSLQLFWLLEFDHRPFLGIQ